MTTDQKMQLPLDPRSDVDDETLQLDRDLSVENQLRAQLDAAIADNQALHHHLEKWKALSRKWERRAHLNGRTDT